MHCGEYHQRGSKRLHLVASRSAQAAVIKAIKEGKTNVDLNVPVTPDGGGDGTTGGGSNAGGSGTTGTEGSGTQGAGPAAR